MKSLAPYSDVCNNEKTIISLDYWTGLHCSTIHARQNAYGHLLCGMNLVESRSNSNLFSM